MRPGRILATLWLTAAACQAHSETTAKHAEHASVLAVTTAVFDAIQTKDTDAMQTQFLAEGASTRVAAAAPAGASTLTRASNAAFIARSFETDASLEERWTEPPTVLVDGDLALVWGRYVFLLNGEVSHCGTNHVDLVRVGGGWKVTNWTWSVETTGCPEAP
ncbi:MAG: nuclear transport factor 2 family protein [Pseudomonadota bacterium]